MKYSIDTLRQANKIIDEHRKKAFEQFEKNKQLAYSHSPLLADIDNELSSSGLMISREIANKKSDINSIIKSIKERNEQLIAEKKKILKSCGFPEDFLTIKYTCNKCNDTGYVDAMPCQCLNDIVSSLSENRAAKISGGEQVSFDSFDISFYPENLNGVPCRAIMQQTLESCKNYADEFSLSSSNLLLFGGTGVGKTHISRAIAKSVCEKGFNVIYISAPDLFTSLEKERFNQQVPFESMQSIVECDLLVIDDLGAEFTTTFTISALYNIINTRILSNLPTIITANLSPSELQQKYSDRIASRLIGCYEHLRFIGNDIRILKKKEKRAL